MRLDLYREHISQNISKTNSQQAKVILKYRTVNFMVSNGIKESSVEFSYVNQLWLINNQIFNHSTPWPKKPTNVTNGYIGSAIFCAPSPLAFDNSSNRHWHICLWFLRTINMANFSDKKPQKVSETRKVKSKCLLRFFFKLLVENTRKSFPQVHREFWSLRLIGEKRYGYCIQIRTYNKTSLIFQLKMFQWYYKQKNYTTLLPHFFPLLL